MGSSPELIAQLQSAEKLEPVRCYTVVQYPMPYWIPFGDHPLKLDRCREY